MVVYFQQDKERRRSGQCERFICVSKFIFIRIKKDEGQGKEKCHAKSMMSKETNERLKRDTQHVPLRQKSTTFFFLENNL